MAHTQQQQFCEEIKNKFPIYFENRKVLDVGSLDINGNNKSLFKNCEYVGLDIAEGANVNIISMIHEYKPDFKYDTIISTNAFEHDFYLDLSLKNIIEILNPGGFFIFTGAYSHPEHGTSTKSNGCSPLTTKIDYWKDYYKSVTEEIVRGSINIDEIFSEYEFRLFFLDLGFWGIKKC